MGQFENSNNVGSYYVKVDVSRISVTIVWLRIIGTRLRTKTRHSREVLHVAYFNAANTYSAARIRIILIIHIGMYFSASKR